MNKRTKGFLSLILIILVVIFILHFLGFFSFVEKQTVIIFKPGEKIFYQWGNNFNQLLHWQSISSENQKLKDQLGRLGVDYVKLLNLEKDNENLRKELGFLKKEQYVYRLVNIIGRLNGNDQVLIIDQGYSSGLKNGLAATFAQGIVVGKIIKVEADQAFVRLLTDTQSQLPVSLVRSATTTGMLKGQVGQSLLMDLIPNNQDIKDGDLVVSSGLQEEIPKGLIVGEVDTVESSIGQIFKQAKVIAPFSYQNLSSLTIILSK
jgi:rod shape-determining protein MreC